MLQESKLIKNMEKEIIVIAEIGINHNGDIKIAKKLIDMAKSSGCHFVKFQKRTIDIVYDSDTLSQLRESPWGTTQREQKEGLEFSENDYDQINAYCKENSIGWFCSAWDIPSLEFLDKYNLKHNKIASAMLTHEEFLNEVARRKVHTYISTGMSNEKEIEDAVSIFVNNDCPFSLFHCVSTYPTPNEDSNLRYMDQLKKKYNCPVGYSGHEAGILPTIVAMSLGADFVERHITLDRSMYGSDQSASLEKKGLDYITNYAKSIPSILGESKKIITEEEKAVAKKLRYFQT